MNVQQMLSTHPDVRGKTTPSLIKCIEECYACAQICLSCADACVAEQEVRMLKQCIRLDLDCVDICAATGRLALRRTGSNEAVLRATLELCAMACGVCAEECERHASHHKHCRICADACHRCQQACEDAIQDIGPGQQAH